MQALEHFDVAHVGSEQYSLNQYPTDLSFTLAFFDPQRPIGMHTSSSAQHCACEFSSSDGHCFQVRAPPSVRSMAVPAFGQHIEPTCSESIKSTIWRVALSVHQPNHRRNHRRRIEEFPRIRNHDPTPRDPSKETALRVSGARLEVIYTASKLGIDVSQSMYNSKHSQCGPGVIDSPPWLNHRHPNSDK